MSKSIIPMLTSSSAESFLNGVKVGTDGTMDIFLGLGAMVAPFISIGCGLAFFVFLCTCGFNWRKVKSEASEHVPACICVCASFIAATSYWSWIAFFEITTSVVQ